METVEIIVLREKLRPLGFNVRTKTMSLGINATITKGADHLPSVFTPENLKYWQPALDAVRSFGKVTFVLNGQKTFGLNHLA